MATLERVKIDVEELARTDLEPMAFYAQFIKHWKTVEFPTPDDDEIEVKDGVIKVIGEGIDAGHSIEVLLDVEQTEDGLRIWSRIEYPSSKFWWIVCLIGIPFGFGLGLLGVFWVLDTMADKPEGAKNQFEKAVKYTAESFANKQAA